MSRPLYLSNLAVLLVLNVVNAGAAPLTRVESTTASLEVGKTIERSIAPDETHAYTLDLNAGQYAHIVVDQHGADVVITVYASDGTKIALTTVRDRLARGTTIERATFVLHSDETFDAFERALREIDEPLPA